MKNRTRSSSPSFHLVLTITAGIVVLLTTVHSGGVECTSDADCDDGLFCNGVESCNLSTYTCVAVSACPPSIPPTVCNEITDSCDPVECTADFHCDDGLFCNGVESCNLSTYTCVAVSACPPSIPPTVCNEITDSCDEVLIFEDGFELGNTSRWSSTVP
jgi:hypothetical protein